MAHWCILGSLRRWSSGGPMGMRGWRLLPRLGVLSGILLILRPAGPKPEEARDGPAERKTIRAHRTSQVTNASAYLSNTKNRNRPSTRGGGSMAQFPTGATRPSARPFVNIYLGRVSIPGLGPASADGSGRRNRRASMRRFRFFRVSSRGHGFSVDHQTPRRVRRNRKSYKK